MTINIVTTEIVSDEQLVEMLATAWDAGFSRGYDAATDDEAGAPPHEPVPGHGDRQATNRPLSIYAS